MRGRAGGRVEYQYPIKQDGGAPTPASVLWGWAIAGLRRQASGAQLGLPSRVEVPDARISDGALNMAPSSTALIEECLIWFGARTKNRATPNANYGSPPYAFP